MPIEQTRSTTITGVAYAALRHGGASEKRAGQELGLRPAVAARLERRLQRGSRGPDAMRPAYARHDEHVDAVLSRGGYPVLRALA